MFLFSRNMSVSTMPFMGTNGTVLFGNINVVVMGTSVIQFLI